MRTKRTRKADGGSKASGYVQLMQAKKQIEFRKITNPSRWMINEYNNGKTPSPRNGQPYQSPRRKSKRKTSKRTKKVQASREATPEASREGSNASQASQQNSARESQASQQNSARESQASQQNSARASQASQQNSAQASQQNSARSSQASQISQSKSSSQASQQSAQPSLSQDESIFGEQEEIVFNAAKDVRKKDRNAPRETEVDEINENQQANERQEFERKEKIRDDLIALRAKVFQCSKDMSMYENKFQQDQKVFEKKRMRLELKGKEREERLAKRANDLKEIKLGYPEIFQYIKSNKQLHEQLRLRRLINITDVNTTDLNEVAKHMTDQIKRLFSTRNA